MNGKRITIRRGAGKSNTVAVNGGVTSEEASVFARAVQAATPSVAQVTASLEAFRRAILFRAPGGVVDGPSRPPPAPAEGTTTGRMSSSSPGVSNIPRNAAGGMFVGVDPAGRGGDASAVAITSVGAGGVLNVHNSATIMDDIASIPSIRDQISREISARLATSLDNDMIAGYTARTSIRERGVPVVQMDYRYESMTTHIMLRVWLMGPSQPHTGAGCSISDEEVTRAHMDNDSEYSAAAYLRGLIVDRLNNALATEVRRTVERCLDAAMATDEGARRQMNRIFTRRGNRG